MPVTYQGPTTMGTPTPRRGSQAGSGSIFGPKRLAVPPHHAGVNVDDEPPARRVARVAADRPRVGHVGTGCEPVARLARGGVPAVDAVTAGQCAARQPEHVASAGDDPVRPERPGVVISRDQQVELA